MENATSAFTVATSLLTGLVYWSPSLGAWWRRRRDRAIPSRSVWFVAACNLLIGWTGIGWVICWVMVLSSGMKSGFSGVLSVLMSGASAGSSAPSAGGSNISYERSTAPQATNCTHCSGSGRTTCPSCHGRGQWWEAPTTADGVGQPAHCQYCVSSGSITCSNCGGSGRVTNIF